MDAKIYNTEGKVAGNITLPESIFAVPWNADLVHQVVTSMQANARTPVAHTKGLGEVRGGGKKPWQQKGTGRARHGSRRSPIWRGGGVAHGPRNDKDFSKRINKKMRVKALYAVLSRKFKDNEIIFVDSFAFSAPKTAQAKAALVALSGAGFSDLANKKRSAALVALSSRDENTEKSFRNIGNIDIEEVRNLNPLNVLSSKYLVLTGGEKALEMLMARSKGAVSVKAEAKVKKSPAKRKVSKK